MVKFSSLAKLVSPRKNKGNTNSNDGVQQPPPTTTVDDVPDPVFFLDSKKTGVHRVPKWLADDDWKEEGRFPTLLRKCFTMYDKKRLTMVDSIAANFKGREIECLATLSREFGLEEDDWENVAHYDFLIRLSDATDVKFNPYSSDYIEEEERGGGGGESGAGVEVVEKGGGRGRKMGGVKRMSIIPKQGSSSVGVKAPVAMGGFKVAMKEEVSEEDRLRAIKMEEWRAKREEQRRLAVEEMERRKVEDEGRLSPMLREAERGRREEKEEEERLRKSQNLNPQPSALYSSPRPSDPRTSEDIVYKPENPPPSSFSTPQPPSEAYFTEASFMSPMISSPSNLRRVQTGDDLGDVLGELERKYVRGKEWEMKEESYLGAGDGWEEDERQRQAQQYQKPPPPQGLQGANDGPFPNNVSYSKAHARAAAAAASSSPVRVQTAGKPSSPDDAYDAQLSHYDSAVRAYKANVGEGLGEMEGRAEFVERWREDEERKKEERERMLMQAKREASRSPKKSPRRNTKVGYDDVTLKLILSTFYAYHKPEKIGMVGGIVDGWKGDKMEILKTLQDKYEVGEETWDSIVKGSWIPNVNTTYSTSRVLPQDDPLNSTLPLDNVPPSTEIARAFEDYLIVQDTVFNAPYNALDAKEDATLEPGDFHSGKDGRFDVVVHEVVFEGKPSDRGNGGWADKLKRKKVRVGYCSVVPVMMNGGKIEEEELDGAAVEMEEGDEVGEDGNVPWKAEFNLPLVMNLGDEDDTTLYGFLVSAYEMTEGGTACLIGKTHIPKGDLSVYEGWKEELWLETSPDTVAHSSYRRPYLRVSYCHRVREDIEGSRRADVIKRCSVENEVLLTRRAIEKAEEEKERIADLFDRLASGDHAGVGEVVRSYFEDLKKYEKAIMDKNRDIKSFQGRNVVNAGTRAGGSDADTFASAGRQKRKSSHFADREGNSLLPARYADGPLDLGRLTALCSSVFDNPGGKGNYTSVVNRFDTGLRHAGKVESKGLKKKEDLMRTGLDGRKSENEPRLEPTSHTPGTPSYLKATIQHRERVNQKEYSPDFDKDTRGRDQGRKEFVEMLKNRERLKGTGGGGRKRLEKERAEKGRWKGFRRSSMEGGVNARGGEEWDEIFRESHTKGIREEGWGDTYKGARIVDASKR